MGVSKNSGTPKSSILIGFSIINHPFGGFPPIFGSTPWILWEATRCCGEAPESLSSLEPLQQPAGPEKEKRRRPEDETYLEVQDT